MPIIVYLLAGNQHVISIIKKILQGRADRYRLQTRYLRSAEIINLTLK